MSKMTSLPCVGEILVFRVKRRGESEWFRGHEFGQVISVNKKSATIKFQLLCPVMMTLSGPDPNVIHHYCTYGAKTRYLCLIRFPTRFRGDEAVVIPTRAKEIRNISKLAFAFIWRGPIEVVQHSTEPESGAPAPANP